MMLEAVAKNPARPTRNERGASCTTNDGPNIPYPSRPPTWIGGESPAGPSRSVLRLSLTSCCGAGVSHRPRRAWHSYSLARTDSSEKARRTHASRPFAVLRATCGPRDFSVMGSFQHASRQRDISRLPGRRFRSSSLKECRRVARPLCTGVDIYHFKTEPFDHRRNLSVIYL